MRKIQFHTQLKAVFGWSCHESIRVAFLIISSNNMRIIEDEYEEEKKNLENVLFHVCELQTRVPIYRYMNK